MKKFTLPLLTAFAMLLGNPANGDVVDSLDFGTPGQGVTHTTTTGFSAPSGTMGGTAPNDWMLTYVAANVSTDTSLNEFITVPTGVMRVQDWGGAGTVTATPWVATSAGTVNIAGSGLTIGDDVFNNVGVEGITWFYSINGGATVNFFLGEAELTGSGNPVGSGVDVGHSFSGLSLNPGDSLSYGFTVNVDGANDGVEISAMTVDFTAIPEPGMSVLLVISLVGLAQCRRRS